MNILRFVVVVVVDVDVFFDVYMVGVVVVFFSDVDVFVGEVVVLMGRELLGVLVVIFLFSVLDCE